MSSYSIKLHIRLNLVSLRKRAVTQESDISSPVFQPLILGLCLRLQHGGIERVTRVELLSLPAGRLDYK